MEPEVARKLLNINGVGWSRIWSQENSVAAS